MPFLSPNQQRQSTEGNNINMHTWQLNSQFHVQTTEHAQKMKSRHVVLTYASGQTDTIIAYFASAAVTVDSSQMTASSSASWSRFSPPSNSVNGHMSTIWFMVCRSPQSQEGDWARPHLHKLVRHGPWPVRKRFITHHVWRGRLKPGEHQWQQVASYAMHSDTD